MMQQCLHEEITCQHGFHIKACEVVPDYQIDMEQKDVLDFLCGLQKETPDEQARCIRFVIWNFALKHVRVVFGFIAHLNLIHEVIFAEMGKTPINLFVPAELLEGGNGTNQRLRVIGFRDGDETCW